MEQRVLSAHRNIARIAGLRHLKWAIPVGEFPEVELHIRAGRYVSPEIVTQFTPSAPPEWIAVARRHMQGFRFAPLVPGLMYVRMVPEMLDGHKPSIHPEKLKSKPARMEPGPCTPFRDVPRHPGWPPPPQPAHRGDRDGGGGVRTKTILPALLGMVEQNFTKDEPHGERQHPPSCPQQQDNATHHECNAIVGLF